MGKSVIDTGDPFLLGVDKPKPKNGKEIPKKEMQSVTVEEDPFLLGVKKKESETVSEDGGTPSPTGTENTVPSTSQLPLEQKESRFKVKNLFAEPEGQTIFDKSFLDRDIDRRGEVDLTNPALTKSTNKYSLRNLYADPAQQRFDEGKELEKINIKSTPESLAAYSKTRLDEINADIEENTKNLKGYSRMPKYSAADAELAGVQTAKLDADITEAQLYKSKFKNSVALQAAKTIVPKYVTPDTPFDAKQIGRDILKVADPDFDLLIQEAETGGASLPGITKANLEKVGIDLSKNYLQSLPVTPATQQKLKEIEEYEKTFDERNFELTAQRAREKLGAYFYDKGKSGFWGYSGRNIEGAINDPEAGLTDTEKKIALDYVLPTEKRLFFSTDIPGSGLFRSAKNAIEKSVVNTGNTVAGWVGDRGDPERAFDILNEEVGGSQFRAPGENPNLKSELSNLTRKENKEKLSKEEQARKVELEKYVDVRSGWSKFVDGTGDLTGQVAEIALLTKGIGLGGRALMALGESGGIVSGLTTSALGTALSNETVGLFLSSYLNSYDGYRQQALQTMPGKENAANRDAYAKTMAAMEGLSERLFNDTKILKAFTKNVAPSIADITSRFINKEITQQLAREELQKTLVDKLKPYAKEFGKSIAQESTEESVVDIADGMAQSIFGGQPFDLVETGKKAVNTFLTTALYSGLIGGMAAKGQVSQNKSQNAFMKSAIVDMANSPTPYLQSVEELRMSGQITQPEANEKIKLIKSASNYLKEIPESVVVSKKVDGQNVISEKQLDYPEASAYLIHRMNEGIINDQLEKTTDEVLKGQLEQQLKRSIEIRKGIIDNTIGVTPNLEEVAADEKKANDLNVLDATKVSQDELIGTPFEGDEVELSSEQIKAAKVLAKANLPGIYDEMAEQDPVKVLQEISQQAQGIDENGNELEGGDRRQDLIKSGVPEKVIDEAISLYPKKAESVVTSTLAFENKKSDIEKIEKELEPISGRYNELVDIVNAKDRKLLDEPSSEEVELNKVQKEMTSLIDKRNKLQDELNAEQQSTPTKGKGVVPSTLENIANTEKAIMDMNVTDDVTFDEAVKKSLGMTNAQYADLTSRDISKLYHKAKVDGSNPALIKAVEDAIAPQQSTPTNEAKQKVRVTADELEAAQPKQTIKPDTDAKEKTTPTKQPENAPKGKSAADNENKQAAKTEATKPKQKEVSEKVKSLTDELRALLVGDEGLAFKEVSNKDIKEGDTKSIESYNQRAERVLKTLYPNAEFKALGTTKEYEQATGRRGEAGVLIRGKDGKHKLFLNLEAIINSDIERTATHEVVHALVSDAIGAKYVDLRKKWDSLLPKLYNVKGFEIVKEHFEKYPSADRPVEGITDLIANIVHGKIKIDDIPKNLWDEFIELVNRAFEAIGIDYKVTPDTFNGFASSVKEAFETGDFTNLKKFTAKGKTEKFFKNHPEFAETSYAMVDSGKRDKKINSFVKAALERGESESDVKEALINNGISGEDAQSFIDSNKDGGLPPTKKVESLVDEEGNKLSGIKKSLVSGKIIEGVDLDKIGDKQMIALGRKIIDSGEVKPESLVTKIITDKHGVLTPEEVVALITYKADLDTALREAYKAANEKQAAGEGLGTLGVEIKDLENKIDDFDVAAVITAQQQSMAFRLRKMMLDRDYNVVTEIEKYKKNNNGEIPAEVEVKFRELDKQLKEVKEKLADAEKRAEQKESQNAVDNIKESVDREKKYTETELQDALKKERAESRKTKKEKVHKSIDETLSKWAKKLSADLPPGTKKQGIGIEDIFKKVGATMKAAYDTGESISQIVKDAVDYISKQLGTTNWDSDGFSKEWTDKLESGQTEKKSKDTPTINEDGSVYIPNEMLRDLVKRGITDIDELTDAVYDKVKKELPDITKREVRDYITNYGKKANPTADELQAQVNTAKRVGRLLSELEDVQNRKRKTTNSISKSKLTEKERELKRQIKSLSKDIPLTDSEQAEKEISDLANSKQRVKDRIRELEEKIKNKDFAKKKKLDPQQDEELVNLNSEKEKIQEQFNQKQYENELKNRSWQHKAEDFALEIFSGIPRILVASWDLSAAFVQGTWRLFTNPIKSKNAFGVMFKHLVSEKAQNDWMNKLKAQPFYPLLKASGLALNDVDGKVSVKEGLFISNWINLLYDFVAKVITLNYKPATNIVKAINPYKASQRAFDGYINSIRLQTFSKVAAQLNRQGYTYESNPKVYEKAADFVNTTTGRGSLGAAEQSSRWLSIVLFAPKKVISELKLFTPYAFVYYAKMPKAVRNKAMLDFATFVTSFVAVNAAIWAARKDWDDDEEDENDNFWNMNSSDFMTHKVGSQRIGLGGGAKTTLVFMSRLISGKFTDQYGRDSVLGERFGKQVNTRLDLMFRF